MARLDRVASVALDAVLALLLLTYGLLAVVAELQPWGATFAAFYSLAIRQVFSSSSPVLD